MKKNNHIVFKLIANLLIASVVLCVLFGNGTHLHTVFDHFPDHGDIHAIVHAHPVESNHSYADEPDGNDTHQHPTVTVELEGTLSQKAVHEAYTDENILTGAGKIQGIKSKTDEKALFFDLPPPDQLILSDFFCSLSLRGPPIG